MSGCIYYLVAPAWGAWIETIKGVEAVGKVVKCMICEKLYRGKEADKHKEETGHNYWEVLIPARSNKAENRIKNITAYWIANERYGFGDITQEDWDGLTECERQSAWQNAEVLTGQIMAIIEEYIGGEK